MQEPHNTDELYEFILMRRKVSQVTFLLSIVIIAYISLTVGLSWIFVFCIVSVSVAILYGYFQLSHTENEFILNWISTYRTAPTRSRRMLLLCSNLEKITLKK